MIIYSSSTKYFIIWVLTSIFSSTNYGIVDTKGNAKFPKLVGTFEKKNTVFEDGNIALIPIQVKDSNGTIIIAGEGRITEYDRKYVLSEVAPATAAGGGAAPATAGGGGAAPPRYSLAVLCATKESKDNNRWKKFVNFFIDNKKVDQIVDVNFFGEDFGQKNQDVKTDKKFDVVLDENCPMSVKLRPDPYNSDDDAGSYLFCSKYLKTGGYFVTREGKFTKILHPEFKKQLEPKGEEIKGPIDIKILKKLGMAKLGIYRFTKDTTKTTGAAPGGGGGSKPEVTGGGRAAPGGGGGGPECIIEKYADSPSEYEAKIVLREFTDANNCNFEGIKVISGQADKLDSVRYDRRCSGYSLNNLFQNKVIQDCSIYQGEEITKIMEKNIRTRF